MATTNRPGPICEIFGTQPHGGFFVRPVRVLVFEDGARLVYENGEPMCEAEPLIDVAVTIGEKGLSRLKTGIARYTHKPGWKPKADTPGVPGKVPAKCKRVGDASPEPEDQGE
jgi:hypothetical protein